MIETCRLRNVAIFFQTILSFVLSRKILLYFFFYFCIVFKNFLTIPTLEIENSRLVILTCAPIAVANDAIEMLPFIINKTIKDLSKYSKEEIYLLSLLFINFLSLISPMKQSLTSILFNLNC